MPELRKDPIVGRWVIIAMSGPSGRTISGKSRTTTASRESARSAKARRSRRRLRSSPIATSAVGPTDRAGAIRVCPTSSPRCKIEGNLNKRGDGIYDMMDGIGAHEVIIEMPATTTSMADLDRRQAFARFSGSIAIAWST